MARYVDRAIVTLTRMIGATAMGPNGPIVFRCLPKTDLRKSAVIRYQDRPGIGKLLNASEVTGQIEVVIWRVLSYTARERARGDNGFSLVSYLLG